MTATTYAPDVMCNLMALGPFTEMNRQESNKVGIAAKEGKEHEKRMGGAVQPEVVGAI